MILSDTPGIVQFIDTWKNIHLFQSFDYSISNPAIITKHKAGVQRVATLCRGHGGNPAWLSQVGFFNGVVLRVGAGLGGVGALVVARPRPPHLFSLFERH